MIPDEELKMPVILGYQIQLIVIFFGLDGLAQIIAHGKTLEWYWWSWLPGSGFFALLMKAIEK